MPTSRGDIARIDALEQKMARVMAELEALTKQATERKKPGPKPKVANEPDQGAD